MRRSAPDRQWEKAKPADREALGHSRGGLSTKVHLVVDQRCRPLAFVTTVGQRHDSVAFELLLSKVAVARLGSGRPRTAAQHLERSVNKLRATRAVANRYDKRDYIYLDICGRRHPDLARDPVSAQLRDTP
jgi:hypothetical protein